MNPVQTSRALPVVVATDGRTESDSALVLGRLLSGPSEQMRVVTVSDATSAPTSAQTTLVSNVLSQMDRVGAPDGSLDLLEGDPPDMIARTARDSDAAMIVCGIGRHLEGVGPFRDETALRLVRHSSVPVLATSPDLDHMPQRIVVGIDFSETSIRAARLALRIAGFGASVYLVHVLPRDQEIRERTHVAILELFDEWEREDAKNAPSANDALHDLRDRLHVPAGMTVRPMVVHGDPATELLAFASGVKADVIAAGANGQGFAGLTMVGRVASRLVRHSRRSVLIVPQAGVVAHAMSA
jgi:nucleotide-binding universal stress UspA family protein